ERPDDLAVEQQEVLRVALARHVDALVAMKVAVQLEDEPVDERARQAPELGGVEVTVGALERRRLLHAALHTPQQLPHPRKLRPGDRRRQRLEQRRLDEKAQRVDLLGRAHGCRRHPDALVGRRDDETVGLETAERRPERGASDAQDSHQLGVCQTLPRQEDAFDDQIAEADVRPPGRVARPRATARSRLYHSCSEASRAPSTRVSSWAHATAGSMMSYPTKVPNPQSVPAITRWRPTSFA